MIDLQKIQYIESQSLTSIDAVKITGTYSIHISAQLSIEELYEQDKKLAKQQIAHEIWHQIYGELICAIRELQIVANSILAEPSHKSYEQFVTINKRIATLLEESKKT